jgi:hypothetical protein
MSTMKKVIKKIYNFYLKGMAKFGTQDHQRQITYLSNLTRLAASIECRHRKNPRRKARIDGFSCYL